MGFLDILHEYWPYIAGVIVLAVVAIVVYNKFKKATAENTLEQPLIELPPDTSHAKEGDTCSYCKKAPLHVVENEQEIRLECSQCAQLHKHWPLQTV
jgi:type II secretory pathway component PulF